MPLGTRPGDKDKEYENRYARGGNLRHQFRKTWPKKKAHAQRAFRHALRTETKAIGCKCNADDVPSVPMSRRAVVRKHPVPTLREDLALKQEARRLMHGARIASRTDTNLYWIEAALCDLLHRADIPAGDDLSDVLRYAAARIEASPAVWDWFIACRPEWVPRLREWRAAVQKERERKRAERLVKARRRLTPAP